LSASIGYASSALNSLINAANSLWSFGGQLTETVFDGGLRGAQVAQARAGYDQAVANYRQTVLTAFQQIEDQLVALRLLAQQIVVADQAVVDAADAEALILNQYKAGLVAYTSVITAQNSTLSDRQTALTLRSNMLNASVSLIVGLGGGWSKGAAPLAQTAK
jgi:outer membrane protein TolC